MPKHILEIKDFLLTSRGKDALSLKTKRSKEGKEIFEDEEKQGKEGWSSVKDEGREVRVLLSSKLDGIKFHTQKADRLKQSFLPGLGVQDLLNKACIKIDLQFEC